MAVPSANMSALWHALAELDPTVPTRWLVNLAALLGLGGHPCGSTVVLGINGRDQQGRPIVTATVSSLPHRSTISHLAVTTDPDPDALALARKLCGCVPFHDMFRTGVWLAAAQALVHSRLEWRKYHADADAASLPVGVVLSHAYFTGRLHEGNRPAATEPAYLQHILAVIACCAVKLDFAGFRPTPAELIQSFLPLYARVRLTDLPHELFDLKRRGHSIDPEYAGTTALIVEQPALAAVLAGDPDALDRAQPEFYLVKSDRDDRTLFAPPCALFPLG